MTVFTGTLYCQNVHWYVIEPATCVCQVDMLYEENNCQARFVWLSKQEIQVNKNDSDTENNEQIDQIAEH